jgi:hypothetical protein
VIVARTSTDRKAVRTILAGKITAVGIEVIEECGSKQQICAGAQTSTRDCVGRFTEGAKIGRYGESGLPLGIRNSQTASARREKCPSCATQPQRRACLRQSQDLGRVGLKPDAKLRRAPRAGCSHLGCQPAVAAHPHIAASTRNVVITAFNCRSRCRA